jgi:hypothetical protein
MKLGRGAAAIVFACAATAGVAGPAEAADGAAVAAPKAVQDCPVGYACLWTQPGWPGAPTWRGRGNNVPLPTSIKNLAQSSVNRDNSRVVCFWHDATGTGVFRMAEGPGSIRQNLNLNTMVMGIKWAKNIASQTWSNC